MEKCSLGTYSLNFRDFTCHECVKNAKCLGGKRIIVDKGFWRTSVLSDKIYKCWAVFDNCLGLNIFLFKNIIKLIFNSISS